jgi:hypothetical protein
MHYGKGWGSQPSAQPMWGRPPAEPCARRRNANGKPDNGEPEAQSLKPIRYPEGNHGRQPGSAVHHGIDEKTKP